jgi:hypothetical protein
LQQIGIHEKVPLPQLLVLSTVASATLQVLACVDQHSPNRPLSGHWKQDGTGVHSGLQYLQQCTEVHIMSKVTIKNFFHVITCSTEWLSQKKWGERLLSIALYVF